MVDDGDDYLTTMSHQLNRVATGCTGHFGGTEWSFKQIQNTFFSF